MRFTPTGTRLVTGFATLLVGAVLAAPVAFAADRVKVGFLSTMTGPGG